MKYLLFIFLSLSLQAKLLISPFDAMMLNFGEDVSIHKKSILLSSKEAEAISKLSNIKLKTKLYKTFTASKEGKILGYGILALYKVRSKNTAVLSIISLDGSLKALEIVAFNEPIEYLPSKRWIEVIHDKHLSPSLAVGKDIPSISGATMSARAVVKASRIALAIYEVKFKK